MGTALNIAGLRFGKLTALERTGSDAHGKTQWRFACDCGATVIATASLVKRGTTSSCGCVRKDQARINGLLGGKCIRHGQAAAKLPEYAAWKTMRQRCLNANSADYKAYGGRGISVCARWELFENFIHDMGPRPDGTSIDRINTNGNYAPDNCRWATSFQQANNRRPRGTGEYSSQKENHFGI